MSQLQFSTRKEERFRGSIRASNDNTIPLGSWPPLRKQLLSQWRKLDDAAIDRTGGDRKSLAALIQYNYGIPARLVESYLANLERALQQA